MSRASEIFIQNCGDKMDKTKARDTDLDTTNIKLEAPQGLDPSLAYLLYVDARGRDGENLMDKTSFTYALCGLQVWLKDKGIQAFIIPITGRDDDLKITAVEVRGAVKS